MGRSTSWHDDQRGDIITGWLVRILVLMAVIAVLAYELLSVTVTNVSLDDNAREVARAARDEYRSERSLQRATMSAAEVARTHGAEVTSVIEDGGVLVVELEKTAPTLIMNRVGPLQDLATATATSTIRWTP